MMVGDHPALEILNTAARVDGELVDSLPSDRDVLLWLSRVGWPAENDLAHLRRMPCSKARERCARQSVFS